MTPNFESGGVESGHGRVTGYGTSVGDPYGQQNEHGEDQTSPPRPPQEPAPASNKAAETEHKEVLVLNIDSEDSDEQSDDRNRSRKQA